MNTLQQKKRIIIIIPTYNELTNITIFLNQIFSLNTKLSVLIIDDNSPDKTAQEVERLRTQFTDLYLIKRKGKLGLGSAYIEGFKYALKEGYEVIIQMDADLSHDPVYLTKMIDLLDKHDMVIGSRYIKNGGVSNWSIDRLILSKTANIFSKILLRIPVNDLTSGFKCIRRNVLENINFENIPSKGYAFQIELTLRTFLKGYKITEYPIIFKERTNAKSKMNFAITIEAFLRLVSLCLKNSCIFQS